MVEKDAPAYTLRDKIREGIALVFVTAALFVLVSLITYDEGDVGAVAYPPHQPVHNSGGIVGAKAAYALLSNFGIAAYAAVFFACFWSFLAFFKRRVEGLYLKLLGAFVAVVAFATLLSLQPMIGADDVGLAGTAPGAGGAYGAAFESLLRDNIGGAGAFLAVMLALTLSMLIATDWMLATAAARAWHGAGPALSWVRSRVSFDWLRRWRASRDQARHEERVLEWTRAQDTGLPATPIVPPMTAFVPDARAAEPVAPLKVEVAPRPVDHKLRAPAEQAPYAQPPIDLFEPPNLEGTKVTPAQIKGCTDVIEKALVDFEVDAKVVGHIPGPSVTTYELALGPGVKTTRVLTLQNDLATKLAVPRVRIVAPLPGRTTVGVEVPNPIPEIVRIRDFIKNQADLEAMRRTPLQILLGKTAGGEQVVRSLTEMPHLLVAGTTGFGKSVCLKSIIVSLVSSMSPEEMKLLLIDPKMVELTTFRDMPHLWAPVITDMAKAPLVLDWLVKEMDERYKLFETLQVSKIDTYNRLGEKKMAQRLLQLEIEESEWGKFPKRLPYIVVVIDELADFMMTSRREVETSIVRLSQKSRAVGIHLVVATQRPSTDVVTGLIKSNMPSRISFRVASHVESKIILDHTGAEGLVAKGEMLMVLSGMLDPIRAQCTLTSDEEAKRIVEFLKRQGAPVYHGELVELNQTGGSFEGTAEDEFFEKAVEVVLQERRGSVSLLQRRLGIGYGRAARIIDAMEKAGIVGPNNGANPREVKLTLEQWQGLKNRDSE